MKGIHTEETFEDVLANSADYDRKDALFHEQLIAIMQPARFAIKYSAWQHRASLATP